MRTDWLVASPTRTQCPYKGVATYWSMQVGDERITDIAWEYPQPLPEAHKLSGTLCFLGDNIAIEVDGEPLS